MLLIYDKPTGRITEIRDQAPGEAYDRAREIYTGLGFGVMDIEDMIPGDRYYVSNGQAVPRPEVSIDGVGPLLADGSDELSLTIAPECSVSIVFDGETIYAVQAGELPISVTQRGDYTIACQPPFPYLPSSIVVTAHEA